MRNSKQASQHEVGISGGYDCRGGASDGGEGMGDGRIQQVYRRYRTATIHVYNEEAKAMMAI